MPGILGKFGTALDHQDGTELDKMLRVMRHESFYGFGSYVDTELAISLGWTSLVPDSKMVWNADREIGLMLSGHCFISGGEMIMFAAKDSQQPRFAVEYVGPSDGFQYESK